MARRSRTSSKVRALAATAGFALALSPAGLALADSNQTTTPAPQEQPVQTSGDQSATPSPSSSSTPTETVNTLTDNTTNGNSVTDNQTPAPSNESGDVNQSTLDAPASPEGSSSDNVNDSKTVQPTESATKDATTPITTETPGQTQDAIQKVDEDQPAQDVKKVDEQTAKNGSTQVNSVSKESKTSTPSEQEPSAAATSAKQSDAKADASPSASRSPELEAQNREAQLKSVSIDAHVQDIGWTGAKTGEAGTTGRGLRMEGVRIKLVDEDGKEVNGVSYKAHVQDYGWMPWTNDGRVGGTTGQALRIEAIKLALSDELAKQYDIVYRVHVQNLGWLDWTSNGAAAGTTGQSLRIESIGAYLQRKNAAKIGSGKASFIGVDNTGPTVYLTSHVQNVGWTGQTEGMAGTVGKSLRLEAFTALLDGVSGGISYKSHVQNVGWMSQVSNGAVSGTTGKSQRVEASSFVLSGEAADKYDIYYRAHVQDYGWLGWAKNGEGLGVGTQGLAKRMEAVQVRLVPKGGAAPSNSGSIIGASMVVPVNLALASSSDSSWQSEVGNGAASGTYGSPIERIKASVTPSIDAVGVAKGGISYQVQSSSGAWSSWSSNSNVAGSLGTDARAIKFALNGDLSKVYDVYYRAHVNNRGWLGWTANGSDAGMTNSETIDAISVMLVAKGNPGPSNVSSTYTMPVLTPNWKSNTIDSYINWAIGIANDDGHGYSQYTRWGPDYDCSSLVISALKHAGLNTGSAITTHNMKQELTQYGWNAIPFTSLGDLQRGDILLNVQNHTEMYIGGGQNVAARISELGTIHGAVGDQTGEEIMVKEFSIYGHGGWDYVLRLRG